MCLIKGALNISAAIAASLVSLMALIIVIYTTTQVTQYDLNISSNPLEIDKTELGSACLLGDTTSVADSNCSILLVLGAMTIGVGVLLGLLQCLTCNLFGLGGLLDGIFAMAGTAAWLYASIMVTDAAKDMKKSEQKLVEPNDPISAKDFKKHNDIRNIIEIMCWIEFGLFACMFAAAFLKCCTCRGRRKAEKDVEKASLDDVPMVATEAPPTAEMGGPSIMAPPQATTTQF